MKRQRTLVILAAITLPVLVWAGWVQYVRHFGGPHVETDTLVDRTEEQIRRSYGQPTVDRPGYHGLGLRNYPPPELPPGPIRTLVFRPRGLFHPEGGTLHVWIAEQEGQWVCFRSCWYRDDVIID